ncbi:MAG: hypothetical protein M0R17_05045 [Candidatus Omnitrophica bacterium]|jgi:hypothetical protein|nr:hypothetical protein [Candidatus Omnitrophota bacterium]
MNKFLYSILFICAWVLIFIIIEDILKINHHQIYAVVGAFLGLINIKMLEKL